MWKNHKIWAKPPLVKKDHKTKIQTESAASYCVSGWEKDPKNPLYPLHPHFNQSLKH
jgi:hypothetical protein